MIIIKMTGVVCDRCRRELLCDNAAYAVSVDWYVSFGGSANEGDAVVFCPECRTQEAWILARDAGRQATSEDVQELHDLTVELMNKKGIRRADKT